MKNHYDWLNKNFLKFTKNLGVPYDTTYLIVAHADKCYSYRETWEKHDILFEYGVAIYLLSYIHPYSKTCRETENGWVNPEKWVIEQYPLFKKALTE
jgi:hypothetical protein